MEVLDILFQAGQGRPGATTPEDILVTQSREERIRKYAYSWYEFRVQNRCRGTREGDWARAEHIVNAEDTITREEGSSGYSDNSA